MFNLLNIKFVQRTSLNRKLIIYTIRTLFVGLLFPLIASIIELNSRKIPIKISTITNLAKEEWVFAILWLVPIILVIAVYLMTKSYNNFTQHLQESVNKEKIIHKRINEFTGKLAQGKINAEYEITDEDDSMGKALIDLRNSLKSNKIEDEKRRKEDDQRHWATEGLAKFAELLRENNENLEELAFNVISNLVNYLKINQGGFFILQQEDETEDNENINTEKYFELSACIAYDRKKYNPKKIEWGEGLIGRCGLEKQTIFMTDIPENYIHITSGLGGTNPKCVLIVPLILNEELHGVVELASFKTLEKFEIDFVEKLAESIASTIASVRINMRTSQLLKESQVQAEKLAKKEEESRNNMEKLKATQLGAAKQAEQFVSFTNSVNHTMIRAEYDTTGKLLYANTKFLQKLGYSGNQEVEGRHISMFISPKDLDRFNKIWTSLAKGGRHYEDYMKHVTKDGKDLWTMATYTCVRNAKAEVEKILFLAIDTTEEKQKSLDYVGQIEALNRSNIKIEYLPDGTVIEANEKFFKAMGFSLTEVKKKTVFDFIAKEDVLTFRVIWHDIITGIPFEGAMRQITEMGEEKWFQVTFSSVNDMYGEVAKVVYIANDITEQKQLQFKLMQQTEKLKEKEEKLERSQDELSQKLMEAKIEMQLQYKEIELVKIRNEKTLEGALDAIVTFNQKGKIQFFNNAAEELWLLSKDYVLNQDLSILLPEEYKGKYQEFIKNYLQSGVSNMIGNRTEVQIVNAEGEEVPILLTLAEAKVGEEHTFTAFIQNVSIELF